MIYDDEYEKERDEMAKAYEADHPMTYHAEQFKFAADWANERAMKRCLEHHPGNLKGYVESKKKISLLKRLLKEAHSLTYCTDPDCEICSIIDGDV